MDNSSENEVKEVVPKKKNIVIPVIIILAVLCCAGLLGFKYFENRKKPVDKEVSIPKINGSFRMSGNGLENFDLAFLQLEDKKENVVYSPLSIKYALHMLSEGANGETKTQIDDIIGDYKSHKYENNEHMAFANALFVKDTYQKYVNNDFVNNLKSKYNADVLYDSFKSPSAINSWVSKNTLGQINNFADSVDGADYMLINALGIDMEWIHLIQPAYFDDDEMITDYQERYGNSRFDYYVNYENEKYSQYIQAIMENHYTGLKFNQNDLVKSLIFGATINKYDIINDLGEDNIRKNITKLYDEWKKDDSCSWNPSAYKNTDEFVNEYIEALGKNYKQFSSSTDFSLYDDDEVKVFAKDLKTYNNTTLQYVGIMPKKADLADYIKNTNSEKISNLISNLKTIDLANFEDGVITNIVGAIPLFNYNYTLSLDEDLNKLGITNVFDSEKADLSKLSTEKSAIKTSHKADIEFSNEGIKASAATSSTGYGDIDCKFEYLYKVPVKNIDLTFDKPYIYLIRDKKTNEVWFVGKVYEPTKYERKEGLDEDIVFDIKEYLYTEK